MTLGELAVIVVFTCVYTFTFTVVFCRFMAHKDEEKPGDDGAAREGKSEMFCGNLDVLIGYLNTYKVADQLNQQAMASTLSLMHLINVLESAKTPGEIKKVLDTLINIPAKFPAPPLPEKDEADTAHEGEDGEYN